VKEEIDMIANRMALLSLALLSTSALAGQDRLDLGEALARASRNQPAILKAEAALESARAKEREARSAFLPTVGLDAAYARLEPQRGQEFDLEPYLPIDIKAPASSENAVDVALGLQLTVFDSGRRSIKSDIARLGVEASGIDLSRARRNVAFLTADTFYALILFGEEAKVLDDQVAALERHLDEARGREETGSSTRYDVLTTQVQMANVERQSIEAKNQYAKARALLSQLTDQTGDFEVVGELLPHELKVDGESALLPPIADREDIELSLVAEREARLELSLAESANYPRISSSFRTGYKNGVLTYENSDVDRPMFNWSLGVTLSMPLFDGFLARNQRSEARAALAARRAGGEELSRAARTEARQAIMDLLASRRQTQASLAQLEKAEEAVDIARTQYLIGAFTNLQFIDSQTSLEQARLEKLRALYREIVCELALKRALGEEVEEPVAK
jgi:outer membrane protein